jgi:hypothetical protein
MSHQTNGWLECLRLTIFGLRTLFKREVKVPAAAHEGEASFASDCSQKVFPSKIDLVLRVHGMTITNGVSAKNG